MTMLRNTVAEQQWGSIPATMCALDGSGNLQPLPANQDVTLLPSATRTATTNSANQTNLTGCGVMVYLNVTAASGTGGLKVAIQVIDPSSGSVGTVFIATTAVTATGIYTYTIYPGLGVSEGALSANCLLPVGWRIQVQHSDGSNYTYSVGASIIF